MKFEKQFFGETEANRRSNDARSRNDPKVEGVPATIESHTLCSVTATLIHFISLTDSEPTLAAHGEVAPRRLKM